MPTVLIVDDEQHIRLLIEQTLEELEDDGVELLTAGDGEEALTVVQHHRPALVFLDVMMPKRNGFEVCRTIKRDLGMNGTYVVMLTAKGEEIDRVVGFELGADDYVVKPFSVRELLLRVGAILRRSSLRPPEENDVIEFGVLKVDRGAHRVWVENREVDFTPLEFRLLVTLYERRNRVQSRASLLDDVRSADSTRIADALTSEVRRLLERATRWLLAQRPQPVDVGTTATSSTTPM